MLESIGRNAIQGLIARAKKKNDLCSKTSGCSRDHHEYPDGAL